MQIKQSENLRPCNTWLKDCMLQAFYICPRCLTFLYCRPLVPSASSSSSLPSPSQFVPSPGDRVFLCSPGWQQFSAVLLRAETADLCHHAQPVFFSLKNGNWYPPAGV